MILKLKETVQKYNAKRELDKFTPLLQRDSIGLNADQLVELIYSPKWERFFWIKLINKDHNLFLGENNSRPEGREPHWSTR